MIYGLLADAVVLLHLSFILFGLFGGFLILWRIFFAWVHLPAAVWISLIEFKGWVCPLTPLENHLRLLAGQEGYSGGFVDRYILPIIYPAGLSADIQVILGIIALLVNLAVYGYCVHRLMKAR